MHRRVVGLMPLLVALLLAGALLAGCERRSQDAPAADAPAASIVATADYGSRVLLDVRADPGQTAMRATRGATEVGTRFAGAFVSSMLGLDSDLAGRRDWFFFVNGVNSSVGAKEVTLADGDVIWWDHRFWGDLMDTPEVVGSWPAPFALPGGRGPEVSAEAPLDAPLRAAGAHLVDGDAAWRVRVGTSDAIASRDAAWRRALADPDRAGLTVTVKAGAITAIGPDGGPREPVPGARALVASVPTGDAPGDGALMVVAGLDQAAADAAAAAVARDPSLLRLAYAVAMDGDGAVLRAGGRAP